MSLFSSRPVNRRRRVKRKKESAWIDESGAPRSRRAKKTSETPRDEVHRLNAQIGAIETFLNRHHQAEVERLKMKKENILPPPDRSKHVQARRSMTLAERRRYLAGRNRTSFRFLVLFCTACALGWWVIFAGV
ncbi:MAG: hypothetical protein MI807_20595 [Verrucomicrobiales bacterium]|nr:hypothetical protein [Verrucomicrobiales bacterium]